jgi:uncharacterized membrane protein
MLSWLRRTLIAGFFVTVPLVVTVVAFIWIFQIVDRWTTPLSERVLGRHVPGLGIVTTAAGLLIAGAVATNVFGRRVLQRGESILLRVPVFRTIYAPVKELAAAFSPDNESGFKRVVLVEGRQGYSLGFLTKEFTVDRGHGAEEMVAVYIPTNHLYLGDIVVCERAKALFPDISVQDGIKIFLTGGTGMPAGFRAGAGDDSPGGFRV